MLPAFAAAGGMAAPAIIYYLAVGADPMLAKGWAIPAATDIAFALGAVSLLGKQVPAALKIFLLTLATLDDFGAIVVIAMFYTEDLSVMASLLAAAALILLFALNRTGVERFSLYLIIGIALWIFVVESGIHATLAGVALAMAIPVRGRNGEAIIAPLEEAIHPHVRYLIMPIFAFANAGLSLTGLSPASLIAPLPLAIMLGLVVGKPLGIVSAVVLAVGSGFAKLPGNAGWSAMIGIGCIAGIGFTMSLFIGSLAFESATQAAQVRLGVIGGSLISAFLGFAILRQSLAKGR
jgi:NhaA family Na+:H+ antiporter